MMAKRRFVESDIDEILSNGVTKATKYQQRSVYNCFVSFTKYKQREINMKTVSNNDLDLLIRDFLASLRNGQSDGEELYKRNTYLTMRQALSREIKEIKGKEVDIINDKRNFPFPMNFSLLVKKTKKRWPGINQPLP